MHSADSLKRKPSKASKAMMVYILMAEATIVAIPSFQFFLLITRPCTAPFIMSMFESCSHVPILVRGITSGFESWMAAHMLYAGFIWIYYGFTAGIVCILEYFRILGR